MINLDTIADFSWAWNHIFFLETSEGNFIWSDPDYNGNNTISRFHGSLEKFLKDNRIPYVRYKGKHTIGGYCGPDVIFPTKEN